MWQLSSQAHYPTIHSQIGENILLFYITNRIILEEQIIAFDSSRPSVDVKQVHVNIQHQTHAMGCVGMEVFRTSSFANTIPSS
jgi:hypothetical protein